MTHLQQHQTLAHMFGCITEEELAVLADVKPSTVKAWRARGTGPTYTKIGSRVLYHNSAIQTYLTLMEIEDSARKSPSPADMLI